MVVVPAGYRENDLIARVYNRLKNGVDNWTSTAGNQNFIGCIFERLLLGDSRCNDLSQIQHTIGRRVVGFVVHVSIHNGLLEFGRYRKNFWIEITNSKVVDFLSLSHQLAYFASEFDDFRTDKIFGHVRHPIVRG